MVTVAALALLAAACGGDDDGAAVASTERITRQATSEPDTIEVDEVALQAILDQWRTDVGAYGATLSLRVPGHDDIHLASGIDGREPELPCRPTAPTAWQASPRPSSPPPLCNSSTRAGCRSTSPSNPGSPNSRTPTRSPSPCCSVTPPASAHGTTVTCIEDLSRSFTPEEVLALQLQAPPAGQPGERFAYTNTGYMAVGVLIERVLDQDLATVIAQRITEPLSLHDTHLDDGSITPRDPARLVRTGPRHGDRLAPPPTGSPHDHGLRGGQHDLVIRGPVGLGRRPVLGRPPRARGHGNHARHAEPVHARRSHRPSGGHRSADAVALRPRRNGVLPRPEPAAIPTRSKSSGTVAVFRATEPCSRTTPPAAQPSSCSPTGGHSPADAWRPAHRPVRTARARLTRQTGRHAHTTRRETEEP